MRATVRLLLAILFTCEPLPILAQPGYQIGFLSGTAVSSPESVEAFRQQLRDLGWAEGRNFSLVFRHGDEEAERLAERSVASRRQAHRMICWPKALLGLHDPARQGSHL